MGKYPTFEERFMNLTSLKGFDLPPRVFLGTIPVSKTKTFFPRFLIKIYIGLDQELLIRSKGLLII